MAFEDMRPDFHPESFASMIREACNKMDDEVGTIFEYLHSITGMGTNEHSVAKHYTFDEE